MGDGNFLLLRLLVVFVEDNGGGALCTGVNVVTQAGAEQRARDTARSSRMIGIILPYVQEQKIPLGNATACFLFVRCRITHSQSLFSSTLRPPSNANGCDAS
jgi:hypothetical protein